MAIDWYGPSILAFYSLAISGSVQNMRRYARLQQHASLPFPISPSIVRYVGVDLITRSRLTI